MNQKNMNDAFRFIVSFFAILNVECSIFHIRKLAISRLRSGSVLN